VQDTAVGDADWAWTVDIWTALAQNEFAGYTAHWIDTEWEFRRLTLDLEYFPQRHTGENIAAKLSSLATAWGKKPTQVTLDSGANGLLGVRTFQQKEGVSIIACLVPL
jgi:hypothetical protein